MLHWDGGLNSPFALAQPGGIVSGSCHIIVFPTIFRAAPNETLKFPVEPPSPWIKNSVLISSPRLRFARSYPIHRLKRTPDFCDVIAGARQFVAWLKAF
jgi:hypothetical protein